MGKIVERTFSGYRLHLPKRLNLFVRNPKTGERIQVIDDLSFWMRQKFSYFQQLADEGKLEEAFKSF